MASLTFERAKLRDRVQSMTEKVVKLKSDLRHTLSARARVEGREVEARNSLREAKVELWKVKDGLQAVQNDLLEARDGLQSALSFRWSGMSCLCFRASYGGLEKRCMQL